LFFGIATSDSDSAIERAEPVLPNLELVANDSKKRKIDTVKKDGRKKKNGKHERNRERVVSEHESATRKDGKNGEGAVTLNSVWIRPRALFAANFSARCRFVQRFYRRIEKIRMLSIFPSPSFLSSRLSFYFHRDAVRKKVSRRNRKDSPSGSFVEEDAVIYTRGKNRF